MNTRNNQYGGVVIFALVGVLLVGLLAGGLYLGKQQANIAKQNTPEPIAIDTEKDAGEMSKDDTTPSPQDEKESTPASAPAASTPPTTQGASAPAASTPRVAAVANTGPSEVLPATGPSSTFVVITMALLTLMLSVFMQSAAHLRRSALKH